MLLFFLDFIIVLLGVLILFSQYFYKYVLIEVYYKKEFTEKLKWSYSKFEIAYNFFNILLLYILSLFRLSYSNFSFLSFFKISGDIEIIKNYLNGLFSFWYISVFFIIIFSTFISLLYNFNEFYYDFFNEKYFESGVLKFLYIFFNIVCFPIFIITMLYSSFKFFIYKFYPENFSNNSKINSVFYFIFYDYLIFTFLLFLMNLFISGVFWGLLNLLISIIILYDNYFYLFDRAKMLRDRGIILVLYFILFLKNFSLFLLLIYNLILNISYFYSFFSSLELVFTFSYFIANIVLSFYFYVIFIEFFYRGIYNQSYWLD